ENARRPSCLSNLKQMGLAVMQYTQDYDEGLPPDSYSSIEEPPGGYWYSTTTWYWPQIIYPYHKSLQVFHCPSSPEPDGRDKRHFHYGANSAIITPAGYDPIKLPTIVASAS